jgi:hypothetical protein
MHHHLPATSKGAFLLAFLLTTVLVAMPASAAALLGSSSATRDGVRADRTMLASASTASGSGCPAQLPASPGQQCSPVAVQLIRETAPSSDGGCSSSLFMQITLVQGITNYAALWQAPNLTSPWLFTSAGGGPYGQQWSTTSITEGPVTFNVPPGDGAWWVGEEGAASGDCDGYPNGSAQAWAVSSCGSAAADVGRVADADCCRTNPSIEGRATRNSRTGNINVDVTASGLGPIATCGRPKISLRLPSGAEDFLGEIDQNGTASAHRTLTGGQVCEVQMTAQVSQGTAKAVRDVPVREKPAVISYDGASRASRGPITVNVTVIHLWPTACGKRLVDFSDGHGTDSLHWATVRPTSATARARLPQSQDCATSGTVQVVQRNNPTGRATRVIDVTGPVPTVCRTTTP